MQQFALSVLLLLSTLFPVSTWGQSSPVAPKNDKLWSVNSFLLYRAIGNVNSPVYLSARLSASPSVKITYCWYDTQLTFGEKVRTSENPVYTEECTYTYGRMTMYRQGGTFYRIYWTSEGEITRIAKYDSNGHEVKSTSLQTFGSSWTSYKQLENHHHIIYIQNVVFTYYWNKYKYMMKLEGYKVSNEPWGLSLNLETVSSHYGKKHGQIAKGWTDHKSSKKLADIYYDGRVKTESGFKPFDLNDSASCAQFIEY